MGWLKTFDAPTKTEMTSQAMVPPMLYYFIGIDLFSPTHIQTLYRVALFYTTITINILRVRPTKAAAGIRHLQIRPGKKFQH